MAGVSSAAVLPSPSQPTLDPCSSFVSPGFTVLINICTSSSTPIANGQSNPPSGQPTTTTPQAQNPNARGSSIGATTPSTTPSISAATPQNTPGSSSATSQITSGPSGPASISSLVPGAAGATGSNVPGAKSGVAPGAVAGIAIAMLIVGGLIAGLIFFFLFRRQKKGSNVQHYNQPGSYSGTTTGLEKGPTVVASAVSGGVDNLLPQPAEDDAITGELSKIRDSIKNHIRTYYDFGSINGVIDDAQLIELAQDSGLKASILANGLKSPSSGNEFPRLFLAWAVLSRCRPDRHPTLLPTEVIGVAPPVPGKDSRHDALYSKWKTITGLLVKPQNGEASSFQSQNLGQVLAHIDQVLAPFAKNTADDNLRRTNLDMIVKRTASFAFLLFTQPGSFRFDFHSRQGSLVVFPSLLQDIGDQGQLLSPPRQLTEHEVVATQGL